MTQPPDKRVVDVLAWLQARLARARRELHEQHDQIEALEAAIAARVAIEIEHAGRGLITGRACVLRPPRVCRATR
jgi:hypothetical protein